MMDPASIQPFDWQRMWFGDLPPLFLLEIVFRTAVMYTYVLLAASLIGKRGVGPITPFQFIIVIALGSATGDPMFYPDIPLIHGIVVLTVIVILERIIAEIATRSKFVDQKIASTPTLVIQDGKIYEKGFKHTKMPKDELYMQLRVAGYQYLGHIERAYLEPSGTLSIFAYPKNLQKNKISLLPPAEEAKK